MNYWARLGVNGPKPIFFFGNTLEQILNGIINTELKWATKYGKIYGNYIGLSPALTVADPELVKQVLVKDFTVFMNRRKLNFEHEIWSKNLFLAEDHSWKIIRTITSPTFSSGKLRGMNLLMDRCINKLVGYFDKISTKGSGVFNTKEVIAGFTIDVIASTSFGTETNINDDQNKKSPFVIHGMNLFRFNPIVFLLGTTMPKWFNNLVDIRYAFPKKSFNFFKELVKSVINHRREDIKEHEKKRNDLVQLLIDAYVYENEFEELIYKNDYDKLTATADNIHHHISSEFKIPNTVKAYNKKTLTENEIIAQCIIFFVAGFETTASTITHCAYELAKNPDVQERLKEEIVQAIEGLEPTSDHYHDTVMNHITYLDAIVKETLRKYPPVIRLERRVAASSGYKLAGIPLEKDQVIQIPTYGIHHSPEYYPEPERFWPERFMPENKHKLIPYAYLPFGQGPRNCIGMRFAYQEIKLCLAKIVPKFQFSSIPGQTPDQLNWRKVSILMSCNPFSLKISKRCQ